MSLPKVSVKTHQLVVPTTKEKITYKPFSVREQKILLEVKDIDDPTEQLRSVKQVISNCVVTPSNFNVDAMSSVDMEYIFINLRAKSVGEVVELKLKHNEVEGCSWESEVAVDLTQVQVQFSDEFESSFMLDDNLGVELRVPGIDELSKIAAGKDEIEQMQIALEVCLYKLYDKEGQVWNLQESDITELRDFIDSLSADNITDMQKFFLNFPKLQHEVRWVCPSCGKADKVVLEGMQNFF